MEKAIKALAWMVRVFEPPVYCYHEIVHNRHVVDQFRAQGVDLRRRRRRGPGRRPAHAVGPRLGPRGGGDGPVRGPGGGRCRLPAGHQGPPRAAGPGPQGLHRALRRPPRPRGGGRDHGRGPRARSACWSGSRTWTDWTTSGSEGDGAHGGPAGPDHAQPRRVGRHRRPGPGAVPRPVDAQPERPVLRHHQPAGRPQGPGRPGRRRGGHRLGELVQHRGPRAGGPVLRLPTGHPGQRRLRAARRPVRHGRGHRRGLGPRGPGPGGGGPAGPDPTGSTARRSPSRRSTSLPRPSCGSCSAASKSALGLLNGVPRPPRRPAAASRRRRVLAGDRTTVAADVLERMAGSAADRADSVRAPVLARDWRS